MKTRLAAVPLALVLTLATGCGGGASAEEWLASVCAQHKQLGDQVSAVYQKVPKASDTNAVRTWALSVFESVQKGSDEMTKTLKELGPPDVEDGEKVQAAWLDRFRASSAAAFKAKDEVAKIKKAGDVEKAFQAFQALATDVTNAEDAKSPELIEIAKDVPACQDGGTSSPR